MKFDDKGRPACPVKIGDRLIVMNRSEKVVVENVFWDEDQHRWKIILDWGQHGMSRVWGDDEGKTWVHVSGLN